MIDPQTLTTILRQIPNLNNLELRFSLFHFFKMEYEYKDFISKNTLHHLFSQIKEMQNVQYISFDMSGNILNNSDCKRLR